MFTGLIEAVCTVKSVSRSAGAMQLAVDLSKLAEETKIGDSIAVNGTCLTVTGIERGIAAFDLSGETLAKSTLGKLKAASHVNIELAMRADGRFGGHIVQGHVDGIATIKAIRSQGQFVDMEFTAGPELLDQMVTKGSVAVDGVSLTIVNMDQSGFGIAVIPETLRKTTLGKARVGDYVNIETDIIIKTIKKQLGKILPQKEKLTVGRLKELGF